MEGAREEMPMLIKNIPGRKFVSSLGGGFLSKNPSDKELARVKSKQEAIENNSLTKALPRQSGEMLREEFPGFSVNYPKTALPKSPQTTCTPRGDPLSKKTIFVNLRLPNMSNRN